jgi:hypothetical protein
MQGQDEMESPKNISIDDPELVELLHSLPKPVYSITEIIAVGPCGRTEVYRHVGSRALETFTVGNRRFAFAVNIGRWLLWLKREGQQKAPRLVGQKKSAAIKSANGQALAEGA